jgi:hypothetical protein
MPVDHLRRCRRVNVMGNVLAALAAYIHQPCKSALNLSKNELNILIFKD